VSDEEKYVTLKWLVAICGSIILICFSVIGFLVQQGLATIQQRHEIQVVISKELRLENKSQGEDIAMLKANYGYILAGMEQIKAGQKEAIDSFMRALEKHERNTASAIRKRSE